MRFISSTILILTLLLQSEKAGAGVLEGLASPVTTPARIPLIVGAGLTVALLLFDEQVVYPTQKEFVNHRPIGRLSKVGDYGGRVIPNGIYLAGMLAAGAFGNEGAIENAKLMLFATAYSTGVTTVLKYTIREPRPNDGSDRKSFPSGHAASAFAFAAVIGARHGLCWGIPAYGLAALVAFSRMNDNKHYAHDVVAGATLGIAYGLGVSYLARQKSAVSWAPIYDRGRKGLSVTYRF